MTIKEILKITLSKYSKGRAPVNYSGMDVPYICANISLGAVFGEYSKEDSIRTLAFLNSQKPSETQHQEFFRGSSFFNGNAWWLYYEIEQRVKFLQKIIELAPQELGKRQRAWVESLEAHPERQGKGSLGLKLEKGYKACCLGEACLVKARLTKKRLPWRGEKLRDEGLKSYVLTDNTKRYFGFRHIEGRFAADERVLLNNTWHLSLSCMNDTGVSWTEIAKFVRENPSKVFTEEK